MSNFFEFVGIIVSSIILVVVIAVIVAIPFYYLWNWLMPELFGLKNITLLQSLGLLLLSGFLFRSSRKCKHD